MDYHTLFVSDLISLVIYAVAVAGLALANRRIAGLGWFALAVLGTLLKTVLQALRGLPPLTLTAPLATYVANVINALVFLCIYLGFRWFLVRHPRPDRVFPGIVLGCVAVYPVVVWYGPRWSFPIAMLPVFLSSGGCLYLLLRRARPQFEAASRVTAFIFLIQIAVAGYRTAIIGYRQMTTIQTGGRGVVTDPHWLVSMLLLTFLDSCFVGSFLWFYFVEQQWALRQMAHTDPLTGALNRRAIQDAAARELSRVSRSGTPLSLIVLDIDHFKHLNDTRGHAAGDVALRELVVLLTTELRTQDRIARSGGEEFQVLLPDTGLDRAREVAERVRAAIERMAIPFQTANGALPIAITASLGVATLRAAQDGWEPLQQRADQAMYAAKRLGRNRVLVEDFGAAIGTPEESAVSSPTLPEAPPSLP